MNFLDYQDEFQDQSRTEAETELIMKMRKLLEQRIYWTRLQMFALLQRRGDSEHVVDHLRENTMEIAEIYKKFYPEEPINEIALLIFEYVRLGWEYLVLRRDGQEYVASDTERRWYIVANDIAEKLHAINPYYDIEDLRIILRTYVDLSVNEINIRLGGGQQTIAEKIGLLFRHVITTADYLAEGIITQFPYAFT